MDPLRILIVDDVFANRLLLTELIKLTGNVPISVENGEQAVEILETEKIDLVFMDIEMPVMNGIETTEHIRMRMPYPLNAIPVIALTAHSPELFFQDYADAGFDDMITKPYSSEKIREKISGMMGEKEGKSEK